MWSVGTCGLRYNMAHFRAPKISTFHSQFSTLNSTLFFHKKQGAKSVYKTLYIYLIFKSVLCYNNFLL